VKDYADFLYVLTGCGIGGILAWIIASLYAKSKTVSRSYFEALSEENQGLSTQLAVSKERLADIEREIARYKSDLKTITDDFHESNRLLATFTAENKALTGKLEVQNRKWKQCINSSTWNLSKLLRRYWRRKPKSLQT